MLKFEIIMERLRSRLLNGNDLASGKLPPLAVISKQEKCSLSTVQRAIQELKKEGVVVTKTGQGTFAVGSNPFKKVLENSNLPIRFVNFCGFNMSDYSMLRQYYQGIDRLFFKLGKGIYSHSLIKRNGVIQPLTVEDLDANVCGNIFFGAYEDEVLRKVMLQCNNIISVDRDLVGMGIDSIVTDNLTGSMLTTNSLIEMGHRNIAYIGSFQSEPEVNGYDPAVSERFKGFKTAMMLKNMPINEELYIPIANRGSDGSLDALKQLLNKKLPFTAIVSFVGFGDRHIKLLNEAGFSVPKDVSLAAAGKIKGDSRLGGAAFSMDNLGDVTWGMMQNRIEKTKQGIFGNSSNAELYAIPPEFEVGETIQAI